MSSLSQSLNIGRSALTSQQRAIATTGHNIANQHTDGFSRQKVKTVAEMPHPTGAGGGVRPAEVTRTFDKFIQRKIIQEQPKNAIFDTRENFLQKIEVVFNEIDGTGLRKNLDEFWDSWNLLANQPESDAARAKVKDRGDNLSDRFRLMSQELQSIRSEANARVAGIVAKVNSIAEQIAELNRQIFNQEIGKGHANDSRDERNLLLEKLASLVNTNWFENDRGEVNVNIGKGWTLVDGRKTFLLHPSMSGGELGMYKVEGRGNNEYRQDLTHSLRSGELKEVLEVRDKMIVDYMHKLDDMAFGLSHQVNKLHATGTGLNSATNMMKSSYGLRPDAQDQPLPFLKDGVFQLHLTDEDNDILETYEIEIQAGVDSIKDIVNRINQTVQNPGLLQASMEEDGSVVIRTGSDRKFIFGVDDTEITLIMGFNNFFETLNGASDIRLSDRVMENPNNISSGRDMVPGDNQVAMAITKLQTQPTMKDNTMTFDEFYNGILADVGLKIQRNQTDKTHQDNMLDQFKQIRSSISSVNADEEMTNLVQHQKAYEASAKFLGTVDEMMATVIQM